ncbi:MAG TPA: hypothetical protein VHD83_07920 [Puia sp.]|nr:hypothetical protein [Puia sp.]
MEQGQGMKRNFKMATILFALAGLLMGISWLFATERPMKMMFSALCIAFLVSAVLQMILYRRQKTLFKDRSTHPE